MISSMGAGNRTDPMSFKIGDIYDTKECPLAKKMRGLCRKNGIERLTAVYSTEPPSMKDKRIGSIAFVPSVAGLLIAKTVVDGLIGR
jgi:tRNA A37 threonylcarbamoyladenosine dehydratase